MVSNPLWGVQPVEVYAAATSVRAGESLSFHVSVADPAPPAAVHLAVYRCDQFDYGPENPFGRVAGEIYQGDYRGMLSPRDDEAAAYLADLEAASYPAGTDASQSGCGWPSATEWAVPEEVTAGVHIAVATYRGDRAYALFVVRPSRPGVATSILCQLACTTHQAYNPWLGGSFYGPPISDSLVPQVSFGRPCQLWDFLLYEQPIVSWLTRHYQVEFCTSLDVHADAQLLDPYQLLIVCGHDEYWSATMRDRVEAFARGGGNLLVLSGNTAYRPIEVDPDLTTMTLRAPTWADLDRPESGTTGVSFSAGRWTQPLPPVGFTVRRPQHWVFAGTGLAEGDQFGHDEGVIGYETDAVPYAEDDTGYPMPTGAEGTSLGYAVLATADLTRPEQLWLDRPGYATLGYCRLGAGLVMAAATTGWGQGLLEDTATVARITANMVDRLRRPAPVTDGVLYALTPEGNLLFYRDVNQDGTGDVTAGTIIATGWDDVTTILGGGGGVILVVTRDGSLRIWKDLHQDGTGPLTAGQVVSPAGWQRFRCVFAGDPGEIYAVTAAGDLLYHRVVSSAGPTTVAPGRVVGHGGWDRFRLVTGGGGAIYAVDGGGDLWFVDHRAPAGPAEAATARRIGQAEWAAATLLLGAGSGVLYVVDQDGRLRWYRDLARDGTGTVARGQVIGRSGWTGFATIAAG